MAANMTSLEAKRIAERHLRTLGFRLGSGPGRMTISAPGVIAKVSARVAPVSRSELVTFSSSRPAGSSDALAYFAVNGFGKTAVEYAAAHRIQLYVIDKAGQVTAVTHIGIRPPGSTRSSGNAPSSRPTSTPRPVFAPYVPVKKTVSSTAVPSRPLAATAENKRANRGFIAAGVAMFVVVGGSVIFGMADSNSDADVAPTRVETTTTRSIAPATTTKAPTRESTPPLGIYSSIETTTAPAYMPPPVYTPPTTTTYVPPPVYTPPPPTTRAPSAAYYKNCDAARAAGVAPLLRGQPGYRSQLDRDDDGIACEWT